MFEKWDRAVEEGEDLNIIPVMNLFMVLIPFLLLGAAFVHIGVIPTSTPTRGEPKKGEPPENPTKVSANLVITRKELRLSFSGPGVPREKLDALGGRWPRKNGEYDLDALQRALRRAKKQYPDSKTLTVLPYEDLEYQTLVHILDRARERKTGVGKDGEPTYTPLFPATIFSKFIPAESGEKGGGG
ncbi:MAG: ExbD/TolR family protein [Bradymonadaceae bacterium]